MSTKIARKFLEFDKLILKFMCRRKKHKVANTVLEKRTRLGLSVVLVLSGTKMLYKGMQNKTMHFRHKDKKNDQ